MNIGHSVLNVSHAFHSSQMKSAEIAFFNVLEKIDFRNANIPIESTLTGSIIHPNHQMIGSYTFRSR